MAEWVFPKTSDFDTRFTDLKDRYHILFDKLNKLKYRDWEGLCCNTFHSGTAYESRSKINIGCLTGDCMSLIADMFSFMNDLVKELNLCRDAEARLCDMVDTISAEKDALLSVQTAHITLIDELKSQISSLKEVLSLNGLNEDGTIDMSAQSDGSEFSLWG